ncbi:LCP family protein [Mycobacterium sp.]|uniref:LCP family protein n=1 Tax=Mycobacterium sp. TaxID=1785 RepID=UPI0012188068|nr:LCP family protein [Mycobacterium sp.]TAM65506.1 MAG: LytR family transcriptional regulator [Mycobacterium sp.]
MSDGENDATRNGRHAPGEAHAQPIPARPSPTLSAAPWERFFEPPPDDGLHRWQPEAAIKPAQPQEDDADHAGSHGSGGVSVADLIAKIGAPDRPIHHRAAPEVGPAEPEVPEFELPESSQPEPEPPLELQKTQVIDDLAYSFDAAWKLRQLMAADYPNDDEPDDQPSDAFDTAADKPKHRRRPMLLAARSVAALAAVLALVMTGGAWQWSTSKNARLNTVNALDPHSDDIRDANAQYGDEDYLIVGLDSRAGDNANMGAGDTSDADGARSDTVMLVNIPANRKRVVAVSFPRDLAITPMQCEAWNPTTGKYGPQYDAKTQTWGPKTIYTETKLNSAFAFGGPKCLVKEIQKLSGLSINRFIGVDFSGFAKMVDALGGVEVCSSSPLHDYELGTVLEQGGRQVLDGSTALNYVRARQVTTEINGDYGRIKRQQLFLSSLLRSLISADTLLDLNRLNNVVNMFISDTVVDNVKSKDLVQLGQSLQGMAAGHVTFVTVPTGVTDQNGDEPPRMSDMRALFDAIINDDPLPEENDQNAKNLSASPGTGASKAPTTRKSPTPAPEAQHQQITTTSPSGVTVRVSNATTQSGLAATATSQLKHDGFNVMSPDDYPSSVTATTVLFSPGNEEAAATVASSFANAKVQRVSGYGQVVQVVLGPDFKSVTAPSPSGSSMSLQIERGSSNAPAKLPEDLTVTNAADTTCE